MKSFTFFRKMVHLTALITNEPDWNNIKAICPDNAIAAIDPNANVAPPEAMLIKFPAMHNQQLRDSELRRPMFC
jgi:hypothetical protein